MPNELEKMNKITNNTLENIKNPPAIEVVFEILLAEEEGLSAVNFAISDKDFNKRFAKKSDITFHQFENVDKNEQITSKYGTLGIIYTNANNKELTQFRLNGFSYNSLGEYPKWQDFIINAMCAWNKYKECRKKHEAVKFGLRFINLIKIPKICENLSEYFSIGINFSDKQNEIGGIIQSQYRYLSKFPDSDYSSIVNFIQQPVVSGDNYKNFIFDIDVVMENLPKIIDDDTIMKHFEEMRDLKNRVFTSHLTNKAMEMYK